MKKKISILLVLVMILNIMLTFSVSAEEGVPGFGVETNPYYWVVAGSNDLLDSYNYAGKVNGQNAVAEGITVSLFLNNFDGATGGNIILDYDETIVQPMFWQKAGKSGSWVDATTAGLTAENKSLQFAYSGEWTDASVSIANGDNYAAMQNGHLPIDWFSTVGVDSIVESAQIAAVSFKFLDGKSSTNLTKDSFKIILDSTYSSLYTATNDPIKISDGVHVYTKDSTPAIGKTYVTINNVNYSYPESADPTEEPTADPTEEPTAEPTTEPTATPTPEYNVPVYQVVVDHNDVEVSRAQVGTVAGLEGAEVKAEAAHLLKADEGNITYGTTATIDDTATAAGASAKIEIIFRRYVKSIPVYFKSGETEIQAVDSISGEEIGTTYDYTAPASINNVGGYDYVIDGSATQEVTIAADATVTFNYTKVLKKYSVTIKYVDTEGATLKADKVVTDLTEGDSYTVDSADKADIKPADGKTYGFKSSTGDTVTVDGDKVITLTFEAKKAPLTIEYKVGETVVRTAYKDVFVGSYTASEADKGSFTEGATSYAFDAEATQNLTVDVTEAGATLTIIVKITQELSSNANLSSVWTGGFNVADFATEKTSYTVDAIRGYANYVIKGIKADKKATVTYTLDGAPQTVADEVLSFPIPLGTTRTVVIKVTAESGATKEYTFVITVPLATNKKVTKFFTDGFSVPAFNADTKAYEVDGIRGYGSYVFKAYTEDPYATVKYATVNSLDDIATTTFNSVGALATSITAGNFKYLVAEVTAGDGSKDYYSVKVTIKADNNLDMTGYFVSGFSLNPLTDIPAINTDKEITMKYIRGYANYVFQLHTSIYSTVRYAVANTGDTVDDSAITGAGYIVIPSADIAGKTIHVKVTTETGVVQVYKFNLVQK